MKNINRSTFSASEKFIIFGLASTLLPFIAVIFLGWGSSIPLIVAAVTGISIVAAAYFLSWATESLQMLVSQAFALAVLALIQVLPEYSFEVVLAWEQRLDLAAATMTGANRLLLGLGWPLIFLVAYFSSRRKGKPIDAIQLDKHQSVEVVFLFIATVYSLVICVKASLSLIDSIILVLIYLAYIVVALRIPSEGGNEEAMRGPALKISTLEPRKKGIAIFALLFFGAFVIFFGAEPFIHSLMSIASSLGISEYFFVQWFAPFLSEFPESLTAFIWAGTVILASMGLANLISSKLNQWTLLIATIPIAYNLSLGHIEVIMLNPQQVEEILLTSAQTFYGVISLADLRFGFREAIPLITLFLIQFFFPETRLAVTAIFFILALYELYIQRNKLTILSEFTKIVWPKHRELWNGR